MSMSAQIWLTRTILMGLISVLSACGTAPDDQNMITNGPELGVPMESSNSTITQGAQQEQPSSTGQETATNQSAQVPIGAAEIGPQPESQSLPEVDPPESSAPGTETGTETETETETETAPIPEPETTPPTDVGCAASSSDLQSSILYLINQARSQARMCGNESYDAAEPLVWNSELEAAAQVHSTDMAQHNFFSHTGSDGSSAAQRASTQGYNWQAIGENIAAGQPTTEHVVQSWLDSPGHCANIMHADFEETAVVCVEDKGAQYRHYWTNMLGAQF